MDIIISALAGLITCYLLGFIVGWVSHPKEGKKCTRSISR